MKEEKNEDLLQEEAFEQEEEKDEDLEDQNEEDLEIDLLDTYDEMMNLADEDDDYLDLEINGSTSRLQIPEKSVAILGTVTIHAAE